MKIIKPSLSCRIFGHRTFGNKVREQCLPAGGENCAFTLYHQKCNVCKLWIVVGSSDPEFFKEQSGRISSNGVVSLEGWGSV